MRPNRHRTTLAFAILLYGALSYAMADTLLVPSEYSTIQAAIDAAVDGDVVEIADGTYTGVGNKDLDFGGKAITVRSASGDPDTCIIDCESNGRGFYFHSGEDPNSIVSGLTITNGAVDISSPGSRDGGGILCMNDSNPQILHCAIVGNTTIEKFYGGGGVSCYNSSPILFNCQIEGNSAAGKNGVGGGVYCHGGSPMISNCVISNNSANNSGGGLYCDQSNPILSNCTISRNFALGYAGGFFCSRNSTPTLSNCTIIRNLAYSAGGFQCESSSNPTLSNCVIWRNSPIANDVALYSNPIVTYSLVQDGSGESWFGEGCLDADPQLTPDGHLMADSPCINAGDPNHDYSAQSDRDGEPRVALGTVDIGSDEWSDGDGDNLPNWWEVHYFGAYQLADPNGNEDGDKLNNLDEYESSRNPKLAPATYYVALSGNDAWDGLASIWDGAHGPKASIQVAIDVCDSYEADTVEIADGLYTGSGNQDLNLEGRVMTVCSASGDPNKCVIDCAGSGSGFGFRGGEGPDSIVSGITITNGTNGISCTYGSSPMFILCTITRNSGSSGYSDGGGIFCAYNSNPTFSKCMITANWAGGGGGVCCYRESRPKFISCAINGNSAIVGGGVCCRDDSNPTLSGCTINGNSATDSGGGILCIFSSPSFSNCAINDNSADFHGGGIYCNDIKRPSLSNCTIASNTSAIGAGIACESDIVYSSDVSSITMSNCILWNGVDQIWNNKSTLILNYCNIQSDVDESWPGVGNIDADPLFVDPDGPDNDPNTWQDNDYRLSPGSPCIDTGDNVAVPRDEFDLDHDGDPNEPLPVDLAGLRRFFDDRNTPDTGLGEHGDPIVDMGAYEFGATIAPGCVGDMNCDGAVNAFDIDPFIIALLQPTQYELLYPDCNRLHADAAANGQINAFDIDPFIAVLLAGGSGTCP